MKKTLCLVVTLVFLVGCMTAARIAVEQATKPSPEQVKMHRHIMSGRTNIQILQRSGVITSINVPFRQAVVDAITWDQKSKEEKLNLFYSWLMYLVSEVGRLSLIDRATMEDSNGKLVGVYEDKKFRIVE